MLGRLWTSCWNSYKKLLAGTGGALTVSWERHSSISWLKIIVSLDYSVSGTVSTFSWCLFCSSRAKILLLTIIGVADLRKGTRALGTTRKVSGTL